ncbi:MAG TPA: hypothetical protein VHB69_14815 [Mycobacteriales bacterium]|nr:hypothetical protein [Mycobacteriales bacterium]
MTTDDDLIEALRSVQHLISRDPRDWSSDRHDAFLYGVFVGWSCDEPHAHDPQCQDRRIEVAARHRWDEDFVARLDRLHGAIRRAIPDQGGAA